MSFFRKIEKEKIAYLIVNEIAAVKQICPEDKELETIENKYVSAEDQALATDMAADLMSELFGFDLNAEDLVNEEAFYRKIEEVEESASTNKKQKKKTKKQEENETARKLETLNITKAVKKIYNDLVKLLHPDREQDEAKREEKTELMKLVTKAYRENNFFSLLHYHQQHMDEHNHQLMHEMADEQLKYYNKLLTEQAKDLQSQINQLKYNPAMRIVYDLMKGSKITQAKMLKQEIKELTSKVKNQEYYNNIISNKKEFRTYLKEFNLEQEMQMQMMESIGGLPFFL